METELQSLLTNLEEMADRHKERKNRYCLQIEIPIFTESDLQDELEYKTREIIEIIKERLGIYD